MVGRGLSHCDGPGGGRRRGHLLWLHLVSKKVQFTATAQIFQELISVLALLAGAAVVALIERRNILDFNLRERIAR